MTWLCGSRPRGWILVDTKFAYNVRELVEVIRSISDKPIKYVLASRYHGDHNGGIGEMIKSGATVVVNDSLRDASSSMNRGNPSRSCARAATRRNVSK